MDFRTLFRRYQLGDILLACVLYVISIIITVACEPHCRSFQWDDARIANPPHADTFPNSSLVVMAFVTPFVYIIGECFAVNAIQRWTAPLRRRTASSPENAVRMDTGAGGGVLDSQPSYGGNAQTVPVVVSEAGSSRTERAGGATVAYAWVRVHLFALALQGIVIDVLKLYCGRLRPDYLSRLAAVGYTADTKGIPSPVEDPRFYCALMGKYPALKEGRLSFPSGHSGVSFSVFVVLTLCFFSHLRPFAFQGSFCRLCLSLLPLTVPIFCAASRTRDNKHHFSDILGGSLIGIAAALLSFHCCFRSSGGPVAMVRARVENEVENMRWRRAAEPGEMQNLSSRSSPPPPLSEDGRNADSAIVTWI